MHETSVELHGKQRKQGKEPRRNLEFPGLWRELQRVLQPSGTSSIYSSTSSSSFFPHVSVSPLP